MLGVVRRLTARVAPALVLTLALPAALEAHAIHTTLTVLTATPAGISLNIRVFADDFSASVANFSGRRPPADSSAPDADVLRYVRAHFAIRDAQGRALNLESCGVRRAAELYWLCFRAALPGGSAGVVVRNQMLTEYHADQVNIVQVEHRGARRTLLFTKASAPSSIT
jgi:hypothetical protein